MKGWIPEECFEDQGRRYVSEEVHDENSTSDNSLYELKFLLLCHVVEDLKIFGTLNVLDASSF